MAKRILITGATGLLGRSLMEVFLNDPEWITLGLGYSRAKSNIPKVDLTDPVLLSATMKEFKPSVVLHSAAERRPDVVEKEEEKTKNLNILATQTLCDVAKEVGAYVLFVSTDYVFDGKNPPYLPSAQASPLNKYGLSKAKGERLVLAASSDNIVLRVPILYGSVEFLDESAVTLLFKNIKDTSKTVKMNHCEKRYPTFCTDLANAFKILIDSRVKDTSLTGVFHWSGNEMMTKYEMAIVMAEVFGISTSHIVPDTTPALGTPRPFDCHLDCSRLEALGATVRTPFKEGIKQVLNTFINE